MKKIIPLILCAALFSVQAESWDDVGNKFKDFGNDIYNGGKKIIDGFKSMGGDVDSAYVYSFEVYNGLQSDVEVRIDKKKEVMGARWNDGTGDTVTIAPGHTSADKFQNEHLYFSINIDSCGFAEHHYSLGQKNDKNVYAYHTYQDENGHKQAERVGLSAGTNELSCMIYNQRRNDANVGFKWGGKSIAIPVEPDSFNTLKSTDWATMRPGILRLPGANITLGERGLGTKVTTKDAEGKETSKTYPMRYNYYIRANGNSVESGMAPGHFKQPVNGKVRDITPVRCNIWNMPVPENPQQDDSIVALDLPWQPLWFGYSGEAIDHDGALIDFPVAQVPNGKCISFDLIRPKTTKGKAKLYIVRLNTTDQKQAKLFMDALMSTKLPRYEDPVSPTLTEQEKKEIFVKKLPAQVGEVTANGVTGVIVGTDYFAPYGLASAGPFYYSVPAPSFGVGNVMSNFTQIMPKLSKALQKELWGKVQKWVKTYAVNPTQVRQEVETFLILNGPKEYVLIDGKKASLNPQGFAILSTLMYGPTSISRMPKWYQTASNDSLKQPKTWADAKDIITL